MYESVCTVLHISLVNKRDEFVFINSGPSGTNMMQSVNQNMDQTPGMGRGARACTEDLGWVGSS